MSPPDSSDVAGKRIEPHITAEGNGSHQGAACKKMCTYGWQVLPIHGFCAAVPQAVGGLSALSAPSRQLSFSKSISLSFYGGLQTFICISSLFPLCPMEES